MAGHCVRVGSSHGAAMCRLTSIFGTPLQCSAVGKRIEAKGCFGGSRALLWINPYSTGYLSMRRLLFDFPPHCPPLPVCRIEVHMTAVSCGYVIVTRPSLPYSGDAHVLGTTGGGDTTPRGAAAHTHKHPRAGLQEPQQAALQPLSVRDAGTLNQVGTGGRGGVSAGSCGSGSGSNSFGVSLLHHQHASSPPIRSASFSISSSLLLNFAFRILDSIHLCSI